METPRMNAWPLPPTLATASPRLGFTAWFVLHVRSGFKWD
jgi:hypothetical protein